MTDEGPYTTIPVVEYNRIAVTIQRLRGRLQRARELLEKGAADQALEILRSEEAAL